MAALTAASDVVLHQAPFGKDARRFTPGNAGSSCAAPHTPVEFMPPIVEHRPALPSITPAIEPALFTAVTTNAEFALAGRDGGPMPALCHVEEDVL
jgi:phosphoheptose isomerase